MNELCPTWNLALAWLWILCGFLSGLGLGLGFHREDWLGGYTSHKRRLYRLGHISFFGLGLANWMFHSTASLLGTGTGLIALASGLFIVGALTMPLCCLWTAHRPAVRGCFAVPVVSLVVGAAIVFGYTIQLAGSVVPPGSTASARRAETGKSPTGYPESTHHE
jgi:hypothetical protein